MCDNLPIEPFPPAFIRQIEADFMRACEPLEPADLADGIGTADRAEKALQRLLERIRRPPRPACRCGAR